MSRFKLGILSAVVLVGLAAPIMVQQHSLGRLREENQSLRQQESQAAQLAAETERLSNLVAQAQSSPALDSEQSRELLRLRGEVAGLRRQTSELARLQAENRQLRIQAAAAPGPMAARREPNRSPADEARNACINNLRQLDGAIQQWALENRKQATDLVTLNDCTPYLKASVICPAGGTSMEDSYRLTDCQSPPLCISSGGGATRGHALQ